MNKIFKLLAVLMLFSALSAGSMTVQAETTDGYVVQINDGDKYISLDAAITAANAGDTIKLLDTIDLGAEDIAPGKAITIDLNGYILKASAFNASGASVVDSSTEKTGVLKVTNCVLDEANTQMPIYNGTDGYAFATMTEQVHRVSEVGADPFKLIFKPDFGAVNELLANGSDAAKVSIGINLEWTGAEAPAKLVYTDDMVKTVYGNSGKAFYIELTGFSNVDDLTITPIVESHLGTTWSETEFNAEVEETVQYTITFVDEDGTTVISTATYDEGATVTVPADPTKAATASHTYEFAGWTPEVATTVMADATYTATYTAKQILYEATWTNEFAVFEAEDTALHATNVVVVTDETYASAGKTLQTNLVRNETAFPSTQEADFGFEFTAPTDGKYHMWVRVASPNDYSSRIWMSLNGVDYSKGAFLFSSGYGEANMVKPENMNGNLSASSSDYGWRKVTLATLKEGETYSVRFLSRSNKTWVDKFIITTDNTFTPKLDKDYDPTETTTE